MKKYYAFLILLSVWTTLFGQNRTRYHHILDGNDLKKLKYINSKTGEKKDLMICSDKLKGIATVDKGSVVFDIWSIDPATDPKKDDPNCISSNTKLGDWRFEINLNRDSLGQSTKPLIIPFRARSFGLGTIPFRIRFPRKDQSATVAAQLSFVANYNWTFGRSIFTHRGVNNYSLGIGPFLGLSIADIKKTTSMDLSKYTLDRNNPALTSGINLILSRNNLGFIVSFGFDNSLGKDSENWYYQRKPWIGFGLNASLGYF